MKKFLVPMFLPLLFSCSNDGFKSEHAASAQKNIECRIAENNCPKISEKLCEEIGGKPIGGDVKCFDGVSSSSDVVDISSSSDAVDVSSSSDVGDVSSSSGVVGVSSSSSTGGGSSSSVIVDDSSSSVVGGGDDSSSSIGGGSSSGGSGSSSSTGGSGSSSSIVAGSSSSVITVSSSSLAPSITCLAAYPYYVAKTKKEPISSFVLNNGCGNVTYTVPTGSGSTTASIVGDSISFSSASASSTQRNITIRPSASSSQCSLPPNNVCSITVVIADDYRDARCNHENIFPVNLAITKTTTVIDYACCEPKSNYKITQCGTANFTLSIDGNVAVTSSNNEANLPDLTPIPEPNTQCTEYGDSPGGLLYRYPKRMLMTVTNALPTGGFSCNSW